MTPCSGHDQKKLFKEKSTLFQNKYQSLKKFWVIFLEKMQFGPKKHFWAEHKNSRFSIILAQTGSVVNPGHFFDGPDVSTKLCWKRSKIKGTYYSEVTQAQNS